jgi:hypothetical protein
MTVFIPIRIEKKQNESPHNMTLYHIDYFELEAIE